MRFAVRREFWSSKRVFVTGHTGFIGAWLSLWLHDLGAEVTGFALPPAGQPNLFDLAWIAGCCRTVVGDIRDDTALRAAIHQAQPEIVLHLAGQAALRQAYAQPRETFEINGQGAVNLLESCRIVAAPKAVVLLSSDRCYEPRNGCYGSRETDRLGAYDPYGASLLCAEWAVQAYRAAFAGHGAALATARTGSLFGGGDWGEDRFMPDAVRAFSARQVLRVHTPEAEQSWQHVVEVLAGVLMLARALFEQGEAYAQGWNFGPTQNQVAAAGVIADILAESWGEDARWEAAPGEMIPEEPPIRFLDATRACRDLEWRPSGNLHGSLRATLRFYRACAYAASPDAIRQLMRSDRVGFAGDNLWSPL